MRVTIEIPSLAVWEQLLGLFLYMNVRVIRSELDTAADVAQSQKALDITRQLAQLGSVDALIDAPVAWQKEQQ